MTFVSLCVECEGYIYPVIGVGGGVLFGIIVPTLTGRIEKLPLLM